MSPDKSLKEFFESDDAEQEIRAAIEDREMNYYNSSKAKTFTPWHNTENN